jgi:two-component system response regulator AdeR
VHALSTLLPKLATHCPACNGLTTVEDALILIVEDEPQISDILVAYFAREGFRTVTAGDGDLALVHHQMLSPDLVVLDVKLPRRDGFEVLATLRARGSTPVIMASAMGEDLDKLSALRIGADDYVVKPFNPAEVVARAKAVLRRTQGTRTPAALLSVAGLTVDTNAHSASLQAGDEPGQALNLTLTEFRLLSFMARSPHKAFSRAELLDACLPPDGEAIERTVDSHVSKLRKKLEAAGGPGWLEGVRGVGYRLKTS